MILPIILAGGCGERLWPLSRELHPKQFLKLDSVNTPLQESLLRLPKNKNILPAIVICHETHRFLVAEQLQQKDINISRIILEPTAKNTAIAISIAALWAKKQNTELTLLVLPADHVINEHDKLHTAIEQAYILAKSGFLVTFGITPTYAETGYGYITAGDLISSTSGFKIKSFVEKPNLAHAAELIKSKKTFWNSGMFMFGSNTIIEEFEKYQPTILHFAEQAMANCIEDQDFVRLKEEFYFPAPSISIDHAIMEKTKRASVIPLDVAWFDIGNWYTLWQQSNKDANNNLIHGNAITIDTNNCLIDSREQLIATIGVQNLVIAATRDAILITQQDKAQRVKEIVQILKTSKPELFTQPHRVVRPWGWFETITHGDNFQVKRILLECNRSISLQLHNHRSEHWVVVKGLARITRGDDVFFLTENQSTYISMGTKHRLENTGATPLEIIEIQSGSYLGEDDIIRFQDQYGRVAKPTIENA